MVTDPFLRPEAEINDDWDRLRFPRDIGWQAAFRFASRWEPYEDFKVVGKDWQINFCTEQWSTLGWSAIGQLGELRIDPPSVAIYVRARGETVGQRVDDGIRTASLLSGLINLKLGRGFQVLRLIDGGPYHKHKPEKITAFRARSRLEIRGLRREHVQEALASIEGQSLTGLAGNVALALRWYDKGMTQESPVDRFISLWESALAIVGPWHHKAHPDAYVDLIDPKKGKDPAPRRMFGDWVRDEMTPGDKKHEERLFEPFDRMVGVRNNVLKGGRIDLEDADVLCAIQCSVRLLNWCLDQVGAPRAAEDF